MRAVPARTDGIALHDRLGRRVRIGRAVARRQDVLARDQRAELTRLVPGDDARRHAELVLERHAARERGDLGLGGEQEEVADLLVVDLPARPLLEPLVRLEAALGDLDIERVRELDAQAARGATLYGQQCASCHGDKLEGVQGPPLTTDVFLGRWQAQPLSDLASKIRNTMPAGNPGTLTPQQSTDLVAHILKTGSCRS